MKKNLPYCDLGDLNGPSGNAFVVVGNIRGALESLKYTLEVKETTELWMDVEPVSYDGGFNKIKHFVDIESAQSVVDEDDDFVYLKVKKEAVYGNSFSFSQPELHRAYSIEQVKDLLDDYDDGVNSLNIYNRTPIFYAKTEEILNFYLNHSDVDLFHKDSFGSSILQVSRNNGELFEIVQKMFTVDAQQTLVAMQEEDIFGRTFWGRVSKNFIDKLNQKDLSEPEKQKEINTFKEFSFMLSSNGFMPQEPKSDYGLSSFEQKTLPLYEICNAVNKNNANIIKDKDFEKFVNIKLFNRGSMTDEMKSIEEFVKIANKIPEKKGKKSVTLKV